MTKSTLAGCFLVVIAAYCLLRLEGNSETLALVATVLVAYYSHDGDEPKKK